MFGKLTQQLEIHDRKVGIRKLPSEIKMNLDAWSSRG